LNLLLLFEEWDISSTRVSRNKGPLSPARLVGIKKNATQVSPPQDHIAIDERKTEDEWVHLVLDEEHTGELDSTQSDQQ
ncbi:MAG: hypothetical protein ACOYJU_07515, partial [Anaerovoracaceae bacterium]